MSAQVIVLSILAFVFFAGVGYMVARDKMEARPFRTTAVVVSVILLLALWLCFHYQLLAIEGGWAEGFVTGAVVMAVLTGLVTALTKLCDDGGESETIKALTLVLTYWSDEAQRKERQDAEASVVNEEEEG